MVYFEIVRVPNYRKEGFHFIINKVIKGWFSKKINTLKDPNDHPMHWGIPRKALQFSEFEKAEEYINEYIRLQLRIEQLDSRKPIVVAKIFPSNCY